MPAVLRLATTLVAPAGSRGRLSVFIFHRVLDAPDPLLPELPDRAFFARQLAWIAEQFEVLAPLEACERLVAGRLPERAAMLTFDDGYRDNLEVALPELQRRGWRAAFFIATGYIGDGIMFNDRVIEALRRTRASALTLSALGLDLPEPQTAPTLPLDDLAQRRAAIDRVLALVKPLPSARRLAAVARLEDVLSAGASASPMLDAGQVGALHAAGMTLGGHTRTHPILASMTAAQARAEIEAGRDDLRALVGEPPALFAYPNGRRGHDWGDEHARMTREVGFAFAFTTDPGAAGAGADPLALPRFTPWDRSRRRFQGRALVNLLRSRRARPDGPSAGGRVRALHGA
jgi:peptidoglycan/xylan/chitin deacetylase (PgdA/CDA1 family)